MQSLWRSFIHQSLLMNSSVHSRRFLPIALQSRVINTNRRTFSTTLEVKQEPQAEITIEERNKKMGVDMQFNQQKHAYVLTFPWNFQEIIKDYEQDYKPIKTGSFWHRFVFNNAKEFHQYCALPDYQNLDKICEGKLAQYVKESVRRIHFHGLDIEMVNLTVEQPQMKLLKVEVQHGISLERNENKPASEYNVQKSSFQGAPYNIYVPKNDTRSFFDHLKQDHKPYVVAATVLIESPMKLYVQNQNFSAVLFGSTDEEIVKNVVRFECQVKWYDFYKQLPTNNKPQFGWKITDFNNVLNENSYLPQY